jgi:hypothetical protein
VCIHALLLFSGSNMHETTVVIYRLKLRFLSLFAYLQVIIVHKKLNLQVNDINTLTPARKSLVSETGLQFEILASDTAVAPIQHAVFLGACNVCEFLLMTMSK